MSTIKILIVEDEWTISEAMSLQLQHSGFHITEVCSSGEDAIISVKKEMPDLVFMDIHLAGKFDGVETAKELKKIGDIPVIFLTNFADQETMRRVNSVKPAAYLLKPFMIRQLLVSISTALYNVANNTAKTSVESDNAEMMRISNHLFIREQSGAYKKYALDDILYIKAERAYSELMTDSGKITYSVSMGALFQKISSSSFLQVHRSFIVNINRIDGLKGNILIMGDHEVPISEAYRAALLQKIPILK